MKLIQLTAFLLILTSSTTAQTEIKVKMGSKTHTFSATEIFNGNESESTYYTISEGVFHYYYVNFYKGKCIKFIHTHCPAKSIDIKTLKYKDYEEVGNFMYLNTKKLNEVVTQIEWDDNDLSGPAIDTNISKTEEMNRSLMLIVSSTATGDKILANIKKGKDL